MKRNFLTCFMLAFLLTSVSVFAQNRTVSGKVTGADDGLPLPQVSVFLKGATSTGVPTNFDGEYSLSVPSEGGTLIFRYLGYVTQEVEIGNRSVINVQLAPDVQSLGEVVVTGFGPQDKRDISGSVASVKGDMIRDMPVPSFDRAIQGRMAGVQISSSNGQPGGAVSVRIRGTGSINAGNDPLYIVDGVQMTSGDQTNLLATSNTLSSINPNDIESIDVLKDAAAASIYGAQAANGVVIITTKRGKDGTPQFNFNASWGVNEPMNQLDMLSGPEYAELQLMNIQNSFDAGLLAQASYDQLVDFWGNPSDQPTYDWQNAVYRQGLTQNYEFTASGGNEWNKFYLSASYNNQEGMVKSSSFERGTVRLNLDTKFTDKLSLKTSLNVSSYGQATALTGGYFTTPTLTYLMIPTNPIYNDDGTYNQNLVGLFNSNTIEAMNKNTNTGNTRTLLGNMQLSYKITDWLTYRASASLDYYVIDEERFFDPTASGTGQSSNGSISRRNETRTNVQTDHTLNFAKSFNSLHNVSGLLGYQYRSDATDFFGVVAQNFATPLLSSLNNTANYNSITGNGTKYVLNGYFGRVGYIYDDKYIFNATFRYDGSSRFGSENRYGFFPSASAAWRISREGFMDNVTFVDDLKLRVSYGETGNNSIGNFDSRDLWGITRYNGNPGFTPSQVPNNELRWERNSSWNVGVDFSLLRGRLNGAVDVYRRDTEDLLLDRPLPRTTGFGSITSNVGSLRNEGVEVELSSTNLVKGDFTWKTTANISFLRSEVLSLTEGQDTLVSSNAGGTFIVGQEARAFYLQAYAGVNPADGRGMWYDENGDIVYENNSGNTRRIMGSLNPDYYGGISNTFSYKGLSLDVFFQYQVGNLISFSTGSYLFQSGSLNDVNQTKDQLYDVWTTPGQVTHVVAPYRNGIHPNGGQYANVNNSNDDRYIWDGSYLRLKTISLTYDIPADLVAKMGLRSLRVYGQGVNLITWTDYPGLDPEVPSDFGAFPQGRSFTLGLNVGF